MAGKHNVLQEVHQAKHHGNLYKVPICGDGEGGVDRKCADPTGTTYSARSFPGLRSVLPSEEQSITHTSGMQTEHAQGQGTTSDLSPPPKKKKKIIGN